MNRIIVLLMILGCCEASVRAGEEPKEKVEKKLSRIEIMLGKIQHVVHVDTLSAAELAQADSTIKEVEKEVKNGKAR